MNQFKFDQEQLSVIDKKGNPWFVAKDVCKILGIGHTPTAMKQLDDDEKLVCVLDTSGQGRETWIINESGLYSLIIRSNKPNAKKFRKWVTSEVLPQIRKTGSYIPSQKITDEEFKQSRKDSTDIFKEAGIEKAHQFIHLTNGIYKVINGMTAPQIRKSKGLDKKSNVRQSLSELEKKLVMIAELTTSLNISARQAIGYYQVKECVQDTKPVIDSVKANMLIGQDRQMLIEGLRKV
jgi:prophage antirepressor-like protein